MIVHWLWKGFPLCGFTVKMPVDWPPEHRWVRKGEPEANCPGCLKHSICPECGRITSNDPDAACGYCSACQYWTSSVRKPPRG